LWLLARDTDEDNESVNITKIPIDIYPLHFTNM